MDGDTCLRPAHFSRSSVQSSIGNVACRSGTNPKADFQNCIALQPSKLVGNVAWSSPNKIVCMQTDREADLHTLARALLEHETLTRDEIQQVFDGTFSKVPVAREAAEAEVEGLLAGHVAQDAAQSRH